MASTKIKDEFVLTLMNLKNIIRIISYILDPIIFILN